MQHICAPWPWRGAPHAVLSRGRLAAGNQGLPTLISSRIGTCRPPPAGQSSLCVAWLHGGLSFAFLWGIRGTAIGQGAPCTWQGLVTAFLSSASGRCNGEEVGNATSGAHTCGGMEGTLKGPTSISWCPIPLYSRLPRLLRSREIVTSGITALKEEIRRSIYACWSWGPWSHPSCRLQQPSPEDLCSSPPFLSWDFSAQVVPFQVSPLCLRT